MTTKQVEPGLDSWKEQQDRQRRVARTRRLGAFAAVAAVLGALAIIALFLASGPSEDAVGPAGDGTPTGGASASPPLVSGLARQDRVLVALDGAETGSIEGIPQDAYAFSLSADGQTIAFVTSDGTEDAVATIQRDGTGLQLLGNGAEPAISPDGSRIAFVRDGDIWVMNVDGTNAHALTRSPYRDEFPQWSPDGTTIVYDNLGSAHSSESGYSESSVIMTVPVTGGEPTRISTGVQESEPAFSPDGSQIVYRRHASIWIMDADGTGAHKVARDTGGTADAPRWSPDGSKIAYTDYTADWRPELDLGQRHGSWPIETVHVLDLTTGENVNLHIAMATFWNTPQWLPTSDGLLLNAVRES